MTDAKHEAPAEGAGELYEQAFHPRDGSEFVEPLDEAVTRVRAALKEGRDVGAEYAQVLIRQGDLRSILNALRARSSAPEAREREPVAWLLENHGSGTEPICRDHPDEWPNTTVYPLFKHPAAPSADKLRTAVEALEFSEDVLSRSPMSTQHWITGNGSVHPNKGIQKIRQALAVLKADDPFNR